MSDCEEAETALRAETPTMIFPSGRTTSPATVSDSPGTMFTTTFPSPENAVSRVPFGRYSATAIRCSNDGVCDVPATRKSPESSSAMA